MTGRSRGVDQQQCSLEGIILIVVAEEETEVAVELVTVKEAAATEVAAIEAASSNKQ